MPWFHNMNWTIFSCQAFHFSVRNSTTVFISFFSHKVYTTKAATAFGCITLIMERRTRMWKHFFLTKRTYYYVGIIEKKVTYIGTFFTHIWISLPRGNWRNSFIATLLRTHTYYLHVVFSNDKSAESQNCINTLHAFKW